ncbi:MAG: hypothetical protein IKZ61_11210 [Prevotella sp.]|nr:hypothetical protein [Prevotella sp.]
MKKEEIGNRVTLCQDGKYRWVYEVNMLTNYSILFDVWKVFGISIVIIIILFTIIFLFTGELSLDIFIGMGKGVFFSAAILAVLSILGYLLYAAISGWKYVALFIMDEKEVTHQQMPREVKKGQIIGALTILAGLASGRPGVIGTGILSQSRSSMTSTLANVKRLIPSRRMNLIKVNQLLAKNRVYVNDEDFDFVYDFLCQHCVNAKKG